MARDPGCRPEPGRTLPSGPGLRVSGGAGATRGCWAGLGSRAAGMSNKELVVPYSTFDDLRGIGFLLYGLSLTRLYLYIYI